MTQPTLLENMRKAHLGNYGVILSLLGCLDHGLQAKRLVDRVIDASAYIPSQYHIQRASIDLCFRVQLTK